MRVYLKKNITAYSGKDGEEDVIYTAHNEGNVCIAMNYTKPKESPQNLVFKSCAENAGTIWNQATADFKNDLKLYAKLLNVNFPDKIKASCYAIFVKMLHTYAKTEGVLVSTLDISGIRTSVIKSVKSAMENNCLTKVNSVIVLDKVI